jgi:hypothetical protein
MRYLLACLVCSCSGSTGGGLVTFTARTGGPEGASGVLEFDTGFKVAPSPSASPIPYRVVLNAATFHLGAVYLNMSVPSSGGPAEQCIKPGIYVGEAFGACNGQVCGVDLNPLSSEMVTFPLPGEGTANRAAEGEVWLSSGDVNAPDDSVAVFTVTDGKATWNGQEWPFTATVTIGSNRAVHSQNPATPGANPICRQRIVGNIRLDPQLNLSNGGTLDLRIDPREMFNNVDFARLTAQPDGTYVIPDNNDDPVGSNLFDGVRANSGVYHFTFTP